MWLVARTKGSKVVSDNTGSNVKNGDILNLQVMCCLPQGWIFEGRKWRNAEGSKVSGNTEDWSSMMNNEIKVCRG